MEIVREIIHTAGAPARIEATADCRELDADGRDICQIDLRIVDAAGHFVPNAANQLHVAISGAGRLLGLDSGDPQSKESYTSDRRRAFAGMAFAIVQAAREAGEIQIAITSEGLEGASLTVRVK